MALDSAPAHLLPKRTGSSPSVRPTPIARRILGTPLFLKLLLGNAAVVALSAAVSLALVLGVVGDSRLAGVVGAVTGGAAVAVLAAVGVSAFLTDLALRPLRNLEATAKAVEQGDLRARAPSSSLADRELGRVVRVFNRMLDSVEESNRHRQKLALGLLEAEERVRSQVARELYDDLAQRLVALRLSVSALDASSAGADPSEIRGGTGIHGRAPEEIRTQVSLALDTTREIARRLRPPELDDLGLVPALEAEIRLLRERSEQDLVLVAGDRAVDPGAESGLALFRILQEALVNALRHADASRIELRIQGDRSQVVAEVEDDGRGFDPGEALRSNGSGPGLLGMRERATYVGGTVEVDSVEGRGTTVRVRVPIGD